MIVDITSIDDATSAPFTTTNIRSPRRFPLDFFSLNALFATSLSSFFIYLHANFIFLSLYPISTNQPHIHSICLHLARFHIDILNPVLHSWILAISFLVREFF